MRLKKIKDFNIDKRYRLATSGRVPDSNLGSRPDFSESNSTRPDYLTSRVKPGFPTIT